ncbi:MAG: DUF5519 family protein [Alphaproteobacteria bacterium]|nr:DUF5519 family protein [Alphaproteobacteria bacterium]
MTPEKETSQSFRLPARKGQKPRTTSPTRSNPMPHKQVSQNAPVELQEALLARMQTLADTAIGDSLVSVPGARALHLCDHCPGGPSAAFQRNREFAHLHPPNDGSLHITLPRKIYDDVIAKGWGEPHPVSGTMMVWGPRDEAELEIVWSLVQASYRFASGKDV